MAISLLVLGAFFALAAVASASPVHTVTVRSGPGTSGSDPNVQASFDGTNWSQAYEVPPDQLYSTITGTGWDSITSDGVGGSADFFYRVFINLPPNAVNPSLSGQYYSDNQGTVFLNTNQVAQNGICVGPAGVANFGFPPGTAPMSFTSSLTPGFNTLSFTVNNCIMSRTGIDFTATAQYTLYPTSTDQCKDGGWQNYTDKNGTPFKNQGDCVAYVATGGKNPPATQ